MQKRTKSLLEELDSLYVERDRKLILENRARNLIETMIRLMEDIERFYPPEQAENLSRKIINAVRQRDVQKFARSVKRTNEDL